MLDLGQNNKEARAFFNARAYVAPQVGLEPTTLRLTAECSAIELLRHVVVSTDRWYYSKEWAGCQGIWEILIEFTELSAAVQD